jgi:hypothetical protein
VGGREDIIFLFLSFFFLHLFLHLLISCLLPSPCPSPCPSFLFLFSFSFSFSLFLSLFFFFFSIFNFFLSPYHTGSDEQIEEANRWQEDGKLGCFSLTEKFAGKTVIHYLNYLIALLDRKYNIYLISFHISSSCFL